MSQVMGISSFGKKKAQQFNINDMVAKARQIAPKVPENALAEDDEESFGPLPPQESNPETEDVTSKKTKKYFDF